MPSKYVCRICGLDCRSPIALELHMRSKHPEAIKGITETKGTTAPETEIKAPPKETVVPIAKIDDPFLSRPIEVYAHIETPETKDSVTDRTATEGIKNTQSSTVTAETKETVAEPSKVEPQKKTATAQATQTVAGKPIVQPIHIRIPKEALSSVEGRRDQPQPEAKPSIMMPLGSVTKEIEVTTKGMEIQVGDER